MATATERKFRAPESLPVVSLPRLRPGAGLGLLQGIVVLDLTTSIAGPYATMLLADFGASVLKVERSPTGDDARAWGPPFLEDESLWFLAVNRNKQSVLLDTSSKEGRAILDDLIAQADVVVTNQLPQVQKKLGLDYDAVKAIKDDAIFVSITGFGLTGERAELTCYDLVAEGYSGIMDVTGSAGGEPQKVGAPAADMLAGQDAAMATVAALFDRLRTGRGRLIDISLVESMTRFLCCRIVPYLGSGELPMRSGGTDSVIAIYQAFETADDPITLGIGTDGIWRRFWNAVGQPAYAADPAFSTNATRRANRKKIVADIQAILSTKPRAYWLETLANASVPAGPINRVDEVTGDRALQERGLFFALEGGHSPIPQVGLGIHIDGQAAIPRMPPPKLGAHTQEILRDVLGYSPEDIERLRSTGAIHV